MNLDDLKKLAGVSFSRSATAGVPNISHTGMEKAELMRKYNIKPGTDEWFKLWFARPYMTGEKPIDNE
jgi:hypothetical protein